MRITDYGYQRVSDRAAEWVLILDANPSAQDQSDFRDWVTDSPEHMKQFLLASAAFREFEKVEAIRCKLAQMYKLECPPDNHAAPDTIKPRWVLPAIAGKALVGIAAVAFVATVLLVLRQQHGLPGVAGVYSASGEFSLGKESFMRLSHEPHAIVHSFGNNHGVQVILLKGEGRFWGKHTAEDSLQVLAGHTFIDDLGTDFKVRRESTATEADVKEGKIRLRTDCGTTADANANTPIIPRSTNPNERVLGPGEQVIIEDSDCGGPPEAKSVADPSGQSKTTAAPEWLHFDDVSVEQAIATFNQWNRTRLVVSDPVLASRHTGGRFRTADLESFIAVLKQQWGARVTRTRALDGTVTITLAGPKER